MHAITVKQPWAEAIAHHGKTVENRSRRPPAHLVGQRIAIHVGQDNNPFFAWETGTAPHLASLDAWMNELARSTFNSPTWGDAPNAGRIIATARLHGVVGQTRIGFDNGDKVLRDALASPWFTGPVGWVLADVRPLAQVVGDGGSCGSVHLEGVRGLCHWCGVPYVKHRPIRGQVYPFELTPEVAAAVLAAESQP